MFEIYAATYTRLCCGHFTGLMIPDRVETLHVPSALDLGG